MLSSRRKLREDTLQGRQQFESESFGSVFDISGSYGQMPAVDISFQQMGVETDGKIRQQCVESLGICRFPLAIEDIEKLGATLSNVLARNQVIDDEVPGLMRQSLTALFGIIGSIHEQKPYSAVGDHAAT